MAPNSIEMSVVIPVYNEEGNINLLYEELLRVLQDFNFNSEVIFIDDGSKDNTFSVIKHLPVSAKVRIRGISLSRNFGHQVTLTAGLEQAKGNVIISLDGDLQHPPSLIPELYKRHLQGYDIVNTIRNDSEETSPLKKISSSLFYKLFNYLSATQIEAAAADFRLLSRRALDAFLSFPDKERFIRGMVVWMGFRQTYVSYQAQPRFAGRSKYTLLKMAGLSLNAITSFSSAPLKLPLIMGGSIFLFSMAYSILTLYNYTKGTALPGGTPLLISTLFLGAMQLISIGVLGIYLGRIFNETKNWPLYFVKETWEGD